MERVLKHIIICTGILFLSSPLFSQYLNTSKRIDFGYGYKKNIDHTEHLTLHQSKLYYFNYEYTVLSSSPTKLTLQITNSNRKIHSNIDYISASTGVLLGLEKSIKAFGKGKWSVYPGGFVNNNFQLNFFPTKDKENFHWENTINMGLNNEVNYQLSKNQSLRLTTATSLYTILYFHQFNRLGEADDRGANGLMETRKGFAKDHIFLNANIGYQFQIFKPFSNSVFFDFTYSSVEKEFGNRYSFFMLTSGVRFYY